MTKCLQQHLMEHTWRSSFDKEHFHMKCVEHAFFTIMSIGDSDFTRHFNFTPLFVFFKFSRKKVQMTTKFC
jgi:hypothetical protein